MLTHWEELLNMDTQVCFIPSDVHFTEDELRNLCEMSYSDYPDEDEDEE